MLGASFGGKPSIEEGMAYRKAILETGKKFIRLKLVNFKVRRMQAIKTINPIRETDSNGLTVYSFTESSGVLKFEPSADNTEMIADILDCEFNREFLATHLSYHFWDIEDREVLKDVEKIAERKAAEVVQRVKDQKPREELMSDEQLEYEINKLSIQKSQREMKKSESATVRPITPKQQKEEPKPKVGKKLVQVEPVTPE